MLRSAISVAGSYILGSIPFGLIVTFSVKGVDVRNFGSGNIGATNVLRVAGKPWGILVFILDFLKGFLAIIAPRLFFPGIAASVLIVSGVAAVCGHNWPVFLKFKGGKGVATSTGVVLGLCFIFPFLSKALLASIAVWLLVFALSKYVSLASIISTLVFSAISLAAGFPVEIKVFSFILAGFIILRHKNNIKRLFAKEEHRF